MQMSRATDEAAVPSQDLVAGQRAAASAPPGAATREQCGSDGLGAGDATLGSALQPQNLTRPTQGCRA